MLAGSHSLDLFTIYAYVVFIDDAMEDSNMISEDHEVLSDVFQQEDISHHSITVCINTWYRYLLNQGQWWREREPAN